jgi:predicted house-cleaning noncanonical NTP pyrophosphatase (MazG superfamily)
MSEKLVRDRIPALFGSPDDRYRRAEEHEFVGVLLDKLREETAELAEDRSIGELVDVVEVAYAIAHALSIDPSELEQARLEKVAERGGFDERVIWIRPAGDRR